MKSKKLRFNPSPRRGGGVGIVRMLAAFMVSGLLILSCDLASTVESVVPGAELAYANGLLTQFTELPAGAQEIAASFNPSANADSPLTYTATALSSTDLPLKAISLTITPGQTLGNGTRIMASARIRVTILNAVVDASYTPKSAVYDLDNTCGFDDADCIIPTGPGKLVVNWRMPDKDPVWPVKLLTDSTMQRDAIVSLHFVAQKY